MKKYLVSIAPIFLLLLSVFTSCQKDKKEINLNLNPVNNLISPANGKSIDLSGGSTEKLQWEPTKAEDGSLVLYEVLFDKEGGDFSKPVYALLSDGKGVQNTLTLTNVQLDEIATVAGASPLQTIKLKWAVQASKGWNALMSAESRVLELKRMLPLPKALSITGAGTEAGTAQMKMKKVSEGIFEAFVKLKAGELKLQDDVNNVYSLQLSGTSFVLVNGAGQTGLTTEKVVWISVNFGNKTGKVVEVKKMELWYCNDNAPAIELPYIGSGTWRKDNVLDFMKKADWTSREERYKYRMLINDGSGDKYYWINSFMGDPGGQDGQYPSSLDYRSINLDKNEGSQWDWGWKFDRNYLNPGNYADYWIVMNGDVVKYNQDYKKR